MEKQKELLTDKKVLKPANMLKKEETKKEKNQTPGRC